MQSTDIKRYQLQSLSFFFVRPFAPFLIPHKWGKPIPSQQVAILTNAINASLFRGVFFINMDFHFTDFLQGDGAAWCRIRLLFRLAALRGGFCHKWLRFHLWIRKQSAKTLSFAPHKPCKPLYLRNNDQIPPRYLKRLRSHVRAIYGGAWNPHCLQTKKTLSSLHLVSCFSPRETPLAAQMPITVLKARPSYRSSRAFVCVRVYVRVRARGVCVASLFLFFLSLFFFLLVLFFFLFLSLFSFSLKFFPEESKNNPSYSRKN